MNAKNRSPSSRVFARIVAALTRATATVALAATAATAATPVAPAGAAERLAVSDERGDAVVIVDAASWNVERRIDVGKRPRGIALSPDGKRLLVALSGSPIGGPGVDESKLPPPDRRADGIGVVDLASGRVERILASGNDPETFAISPDGRTLYATNEDSESVTFVDLATGRIVGTVKVGDEPEGIDVSRDGRRLFVACEASDAIYVVDVAKRRVEKTVPFAGRPRTILTSRDGARVYAAIEFAGKLAVIDAKTLAVQRTVDLADASGLSRPMGLAERPDGTVAVALGRSGAIAEVNPATGKVVRRVADVGARPWGLALSADGVVAYTANGSSGDVSAVDLASGKVLRKLKVGTSPWGIVRLPAAK
jgi:YVTN family beta-propeller protein